jgi:subtilase family serine protease
MKAARLWALTGSIGLGVSFLAAAGSAAAATHPSGRVTMHGSLVPAAERAHPAGAVSAKSTVSFDLTLKVRDAAGARKFALAVSTPRSKQFHRYLTTAQWVAKYSPTKAEVSAAERWLRSEGLTVGSVPKDRLFIAAHGSAAKVEHAFGVSLGMFKVAGHKLRLAKGTLSIPRSVSGSISGVVGVSQALESTALTSTPAASAAKPKVSEPGPPAGFANPQPCSAYWGQKTDTADSSSLYAPFTAPQSYDICGYKPAQLRSAYGLARSVRRGNNGHGITVAIVDAYDSPTLFADAHRYFRLNDRSHPLRASQFTNVQPTALGNEDICGGSGWYAEQALDVESVHSMAPGAHIEYVGANDCFDNNLLAGVDTAVATANVVTDSWGDTLGDIFEGPAAEAVFDTEFQKADATGVSVLFSSGDDGDNFADFGIDAPDYPATSPFITAVGGTTLEVNRFGSNIGQYGWSTAKQTLCAGVSTTNCGSATTPAGSLAWQAGGGGGTSYSYAEPSYQVGVVPDALANRNDTVEGAARVEPDISMDADAQSGLLIGLTQVYPNGTHYGQFKEGGTSLASPLLAGVIADTDQAAKSHGNAVLGFLNPVLYGNYLSHPTAFQDIVPPFSPNATSVIRVDFANTVDNSDGYNVSLRVIGYAGPETYCDGTGNCATRPVTLTAGSGFDSLTGLGTPGPNFVSEFSQF